MPGIIAIGAFFAFMLFLLSQGLEGNTFALLLFFLILGGGALLAVA